MDIIKENFFPKNVIAGLATGNSENNGNLSFYKTDFYNKDDVINARNRFESYIISKNSKNIEFVYQNQKHTDIVRYVNTNNTNSKDISDAMITDCKNIILNISVADCAAVLIYDSNKLVVAAIHSGWRGTKQNIISKTIAILIDTYKCNSNDIQAMIMPSASIENYEVGKEFCDYFPNSTVNTNGKFYFDNKKEITMQLLDCNISESNIVISNECSIKNNRFHSFRRDGSKSGRMNAFIGIID